MRKIIWADCHRYGCYPLGDKPSKLEPGTGANDVWLGDNVDIVNCKKKNVKHARAELLAIKKYHKGIVVNSNHEGGVGKDLFPDYVIRDGVLYCHGHHVFYSEKKVEDWENKKLGLGKWGRFTRTVKNSFTRSGKGKVSKSQLQKIANYARVRGCHSICCGHLHKKHDDAFDGIRIVVVGRGRTEVSI